MFCFVLFLFVVVVVVVVFTMNPKKVFVDGGASKGREDEGTDEGIVHYIAGGGGGGVGGGDGRYI